MTIDIEPILRLARNPVIAAGMIGDAIAEGRISLPDDWRDDLLEAATLDIETLVHALDQGGHFLTCSCTCDCDDAACTQAEHRTCAWHQFHCPYEGDES